MKDDSHLYLDLEELRQRGWTETLVKRFLGTADRWEAVDHWLNYTGKRAYFLEQIQLAEATREFSAAFAASIERRKLSNKEVGKFHRARRTNANAAHKWRESLTEGDIKTKLALEKVAKIVEEVRRRGYRTPHKA